MSRSPSPPHRGSRGRTCGHARRRPDGRTRNRGASGRGPCCGRCRSGPNSSCGCRRCRGRRRRRCPRSRRCSCPRPGWRTPPSRPRAVVEHQLEAPMPGLDHPADEQVHVAVEVPVRRLEAMAVVDHGDGRLLQVPSTRGVVERYQATAWPGALGLGEGDVVAAVAVEVAHDHLAGIGGPIAVLVEPGGVDDLPRVVRGRSGPRRASRASGTRTRSG